MSARLACLFGLLGLAHAQESALRIDSSPQGAAVLLGGTPLGQTPIDASIAPGEYTFIVSLPGFSPVTHTLKLDPGVPKAWRATLVAAPPAGLPDQPAWLRDGCLGVTGCGLGHSDHPSPAVAETSAWVRGAAGARASVEARVRLRTARNGTDAAWVRIHTVGRQWITRVRRHLERGRVVVQVLPGLASYVTTVGVADVRGDPQTASARARLAALCQGLRWWFVVRDGMALEVEEALYDPTPIGEVYSRRVAFAIGGALGETGSDVALAARTEDREAVRRQAGGVMSSAASFSDVVDVQIRQHGVRHVVRVRDGVATIETGGDPARVLDDLERVLHTARIQTAYTPAAPFNGARVERAILR